MQKRRFLVPALTAATVLAALAVGPVRDVAAATDDRGATEAVLREVGASSKKDVAAEMVARARGALERAAKLRAAGDEAHARVADGLAKTWADAARDILRAIDNEEKAVALRRAA